MRGRVKKYSVFKKNPEHFWFFFVKKCLHISPKISVLLFKKIACFFTKNSVFLKNLSVLFLNLIFWNSSMYSFQSFQFLKTFPRTVFKIVQFFENLLCTVFTFSVFLFNIFHLKNQGIKNFCLFFKILNFMKKCQYIF